MAIHWRQVNCLLFFFFSPSLSSPRSAHCGPSLTLFTTGQSCMLCTLCVNKYTRLLQSLSSQCVLRWSWAKSRAARCNTYLLLVSMHPFLSFTCLVFSLIFFLSSTLLPPSSYVTFATVQSISAHTALWDGEKERMRNLLPRDFRLPATLAISWWSFLTLLLLTLSLSPTLSHTLHKSLHASLPEPFRHLTHQLLFPPICLTIIRLHYFNLHHHFFLIDIFIISSH